MTIQFNKIGNTFVAEATGIDLRDGIDAAMAKTIDMALATYGVLIFPGQLINDDQQQAFIQQFGQP